MDVSERRIAQAPGDHPQSEMSARLQESPRVAALHQLAHHLRINLAAIPVDLRVLLERSGHPSRPEIGGFVVRSCFGGISHGGKKRIQRILHVKPG